VEWAVCQQGDRFVHGAQGQAIHRPAATATTGGSNSACTETGDSVSMDRRLAVMLAKGSSLVRWETAGAGRATAGN